MRAAQRLTPFSRACAESVSIVLAPMPRAGVLTTLRKLVSSQGFVMTLRYPRTFFTSARSKNLRPP